jgi:hypothetical protein
VQESLYDLRDIVRHTWARTLVSSFDKSLKDMNLYKKGTLRPPADKYFAPDTMDKLARMPEAEQPSSRVAVGSGFAINTRLGR